MFSKTCAEAFKQQRCQSGMKPFCISFCGVTGVSLAINLSLHQLHTFYQQDSIEHQQKLVTLKTVTGNKQDVP